MDDPRGRLTRDGIRIHEPADFAGMRTAGRLAAKILDEVRLPAWIPSRTIRTEGDDAPAVGNPPPHPFRHWPTRGAL